MVRDAVNRWSESKNSVSTIDSNQTKPAGRKATRRPFYWSARRTRRREISQTYWAQEQVESETGISLTTRMDLLAQYGDFSLAYSTAVQPRLMYFGDHRGYLAHRSRWGMPFVLGDFVAETSRGAELIDEFIDLNPRTSFCQITRPVAELLSKRGYFVNEMGTDTTLKLADFTFAGKEKEWLRYASNWISRRGFEIVESCFDEIGAEQVEDVSESWRKTRTVKRKEVRFLNRPIVMKDEPGVRKFFLLSPEKKLLAFVFLDPLYRNGRIAGYVTVLKRRRPDAPRYAEQAIMKYIIETLKHEEVAELKLGLSPLADIQDGDFKFNKFTSRLFQYGFRARWVNQYFYNVAGHADYKRRFGGRPEKLYFASPTRFNTPKMMALIGLCGIA